MFGFQRIGDLIWAAADMRCRGFLMGGTAGRTTLAGEGLQHQDGNSHLLAYPVPNLHAYDPAFAYELAVILEDGLRRMYVDQEDVFYYVTVENEPYAMPPMPEGAREGILAGLYLYRVSKLDGDGPRAALMGSGAILNEALKAAEILETRYDVAADVWSATSYKALHRDALEVDRRNRLNPAGPQDVPYVTKCFADEPDVVVAASDYVKALPYSVARFIPAPFCGLGTDGFGRSEARPELRDFFEVDAKHIAFAALSTLARNGALEPSLAERAMADLGIDPDVDNPVRR
jgi:pyruvate dehydrogenase E1 component